MNLKFYKTGAKPTTVGSLWFNPTTKRIELITGTSTSDVYGSDIQDATYSNDILTIEKIDGSTITINLSGYATSSELENSLANKLNKIKVNNSTVNSADLNIVGSGGTTVSNNSGTITISSETVPTSFDASIITSGTIDLERLPKGALERLFIVSSESDAMNADCQEGDTVQVTGNDNKMYFCVNDSATTFANKFREYTAGAATSVPWSGVTGKPNVEDGAQKNVQSDWNAISGDAFILNKPTIPTKTSQLTNDSDFATQTVVTTALATKANKTEVEPYDLSWLVSYPSGVAIPDEKAEELMGVLNNHQLAFIRIRTDNDFMDILLQGSLFHQGTKNTITFSDINVDFIHLIIIDNYTLGDSTWSVVKEIQIEPVSRSSLKTLNGQSLIGTGDIAIEAPKPLYIKVISSSSKTLNYTAKEIYDAIEAGRLLIFSPEEGRNSPQPVVHIDHFYQKNKYYIHLTCFSVLGVKSTDGDSAILWDLYIGEAAASSYNYTSISYYRWKWPDITSIANKQDKLISGTNIKTINGVSVLGAGDIKTPAPTKVSELENDEGYLTEHQSLDGYARKREVVKTYPDTIGYGTSYIDDMSSIELSANKFNIVGRCGGLRLALPAGSDLDGQEYCCQFYVANSTYILTVPADVRWQNGEVPTFEGNTCCQLVIVNNCATIGVFKASS